MSNAKLLPCPFCGEREVSLPTLNRERGWFIGCLNLACKVNPATPSCGCKEAAIEAWNTRAANPKAALAKMRSAEEYLKLLYDFSPYNRVVEVMDKDGALSWISFIQQDAIASALGQSSTVPLTPAALDQLDDRQCADCGYPVGDKPVFLGGVWFCATCNPAISLLGGDIES